MTKVVPFIRYKDEGLTVEQGNHLVDNTLTGCVVMLNPEPLVSGSLLFTTANVHECLQQIEQHILVYYYNASYIVYSYWTVVFLNVGN